MTAAEDEAGHRHADVAGHKLTAAEDEAGHKLTAAEDEAGHKLTAAEDEAGLR